MGISCELYEKTCIPCRGDVPPLPAEQLRVLLNKLDKWRLNENGHLYKEFVFINFIKAINFANEIAAIAEKQGHHPNLIIAWGQCSVEIWTHKISGLTESDFILASKIDRLGV